MKASDWKYKSIIFNINVFLTVIHRGIINFLIILNLLHIYDECIIF